MLISAVCYSVSVYAWFQESTVNLGNVIRSAEYGIAVSVKNGDKEITSDGGKYTLLGGTQYNVTLTAYGGAAARGYEIVSCGSRRLFTDTIPTGTSLTLTLIPEKDAGYIYSSQWGDV